MINDSGITKKEQEQNPQTIVDIVTSTRIPLKSLKTTLCGRNLTTPELQKCDKHHSHLDLYHLKWSTHQITLQ